MPVVTIGQNTADDFSGAAGAQLLDGNPTTNYGEANYGYISQMGINNNYHYLLVFSGLSNISAPVTVNSATIYIYAHGTTTPGPTIHGRPLLVPFVQNEATWNIRSTGNNWTTAGAMSDGNDRRAVVSFTDTAADGLSGAYASFTANQLASDIEDQIDGTLNNYGFVLEENGDSRNLQHQDYGDGERPYVSVDYTAGAGGVVPFTPFSGPFGGPFARPL